MMKNRNIKIGALLAMAMLTCAGVMAAQFRELLTEEKAAYGATHELSISFADLIAAGVTATNIPYTNNVSVAANRTVEFVAARLVKAFDGDTNVTGNLHLTIGDASDDDRFLTATETAADGTEVWIASPRQTSWATTTTNVTWITGLDGEVTNTQPLVLSIAATTYGLAYYNVATQIVTKLTPNYSESIGDYTEGQVKLHFRIFEPK